MSRSPTFRQRNRLAARARRGASRRPPARIWVRESIVDADKRVAMIDTLGFGSANVVVAVPQAWIDVRTMADLDDVTTGFRAQHNRRMRVATKYINLTRKLLRLARHRRLPHRRERRRDRRRARGRHRRDDRRHHHDRGDACGQRPQSARRRRHPAQSGQSGRLARGRLVGCGGKRPRASSSITSRPARAPANTRKSALASRNALRLS